MTKSVIVMLKEPRPGSVKTRLARDIGTIPALWWYRHHTAKMLRCLDDPRWQLVLAVAPDLSVLSRNWPNHLPRLAQGAGHLGQRMARMFRAMPPGPTVLVGSDIKDLRPKHITKAFERLGQSDAIFGPAPDGGYWLVGFKHNPPKGAFQSVRWSGPNALSDSVASLGRLKIAYVDSLQDVDHGRDLR